MPNAPSSPSLGAPPPDLLQKCKAFTFVDELKERNLYPFLRVLEASSETEVQVNGRRMLMMGSNNYQNLTTHPHVKQRAIEALETYGCSCAGSRFLNGTLPIHLELERRLAAFVGKEAALVFPTGFMTNLGTVSALVRPGNYVLVDKQVHACIIDGTGLSRGTLVRFNHGDMEDLERRLRNLPPGATKLIVTDGVFSMEGDVAKLPEIIALAQRYEAQVLMDDAHGMGVMGPEGRGTAAHFGLTEEVDLIMGSFSKTLAAIGGFIAGSERTMNYLMHHARPFLFSASASPASVGATLGALEVMEREPHLLQQLWRNARFLHQGFRERGFDIGASCTPIIPVMVGDFERCLQVWRYLEDAGIYVNPVVPPGVPEGGALIRVSVTAAHTEAQLAGALEVFEEAGRRFGLLGAAS